MSGAAVAKRERVSITRPLKVLIPLIQADLEEGDRAGMQYYADAGDKLIEAKEQVPHGRWGAWLSKNFERSSSQARLYMQWARLRADHAENADAVGNLPRSIRQVGGATERDRKRRKVDASYQSVLRELETDFFAREKQTRSDEVRLHREIALELIDVGFKALATRLHPDRGGSKEAMARLNRVRDELKGVAETRRFV